MPNIGLPELIIIIVVLGGFALWIVALIDAIKVPSDDLYRAGNKVVWVLVIALTGFIGALIYYAVGRPSRTALGGNQARVDPPPPPDDII